MENVRQRQRADKPDRVERERLVATCIATGLHSLTPAEGRVYEALAQSGLFEAGAVIVGTHAFLHIGNMLCVRWARSMGQTEDIDIAKEQKITVASPPVEIDIKEIFLDADKGVLPVPALDSRQPSTKFRLRNRNLTVSLLTPLRGRPSSKPVVITGLNAAAEPMRFLDYLIEESQPATVPVGSGLLIRVPAPARFALHKLVVSQRRPAALAAKSRKDLEQAAAVLEVLKGLRPGDVKAAAVAAVCVGGKFLAQIVSAANLLDDELATLVRDAVS